METVMIHDHKLCDTARYMGQHRTNAEAVQKALEFYIRHLRQAAVVQKQNINSGSYETLMNELSYAGHSFTRPSESIPRLKAKAG